VANWAFTPAVPLLCMPSVTAWSNLSRICRSAAKQQAGGMPRITSSCRCSVLACDLTALGAAPRRADVADQVWFVQKGRLTRPCSRRDSGARALTDFRWVAPGARAQGSWGAGRCPNDWQTCRTCTTNPGWRQAAWAERLLPRQATIGDPQLPQAHLGASGHHQPGPAIGLRGVAGRMVLGIEAALGTGLSITARPHTESDGVARLVSATGD
jgi:hypothetical protein